MGQCRAYSKGEKFRMALLYASGKSLKSVGSILHCPWQTVWFVLGQYGIPCRSISESTRGRKLSKEHIEKRIIAQTGKKRPLEFRRKMSEAAKRRGANHNWYVDGKGAERDTARRREMDRFRYKLWRESVFERDAFTCQICKRRGSIVLRADHIKSWKNYPEFRYSVDNGRTLCDACHRQTPTYGAKLIAESEL